jgi:phage terminase large subunit
MSKKTDIKVGRVFKRLINASATVVVNVGGARSGKSYATAQLLIMKALNSTVSIAVTRKTMPALKMTSYRLIIELLRKYGLYKSAAHNKTENYYILNGSRFQFFSLDDAEKIKSSEFNYIWLEEATEFTYNDYLVLLTRLSAPSANGKNQMFLTLNPTDANCWIARSLLSRPDVQVIESSYKDNPFLAQEYIKTLLSLKEYDANAYNVFALGKWGQNDKTIYTHWGYAQEEPQNADDIIWGLDFGFNNPSALVKIYIKDNVFTVKECLYQSGLTTQQLTEKLADFIPPADRAQTIYADAAEPDRIAQIALAGFNIKPADKAVLNGIMAVKAAKLFITKDSVNLIKEIQTYSWKTTQEGITLEDPVKFNDHALDALRYAIYTRSREAAQSGAAEVSFI